MPSDSANKALAANDYAELIEAAFEEKESDGIVMLPLTPARIEAAVAASGRNGDELLGRFAGRPAVHVKDVAEVAMQAGCQPAYMPLLITAVKIMLEDGFPSPFFLDSRCGYFPYLVINGPLREEIGLNCRPNVFGPGFRANATIGRALNLMLMRFGGADLFRSTIGNAYKFTCVIGEDEEHSPWPPLSVALGFGANESTVTLMVGIQTKVLSHQLSKRPEHLLSTFAEEVSTVSQFDQPDVRIRPGGYTPKAVMVLAEDHRGYMRDAGWDRKRMQAYLYEVTQRSVNDAKRAGYRTDARLVGRRDDELVKIYGSPEDFLIISAGSGGGRSMIGTAAYAVTRRVEIPAVTKAGPPVVKATNDLDRYVVAAESIIDRKMTDGWPVIPADRERVARFVAASERAANAALGAAQWRSGPITVQDLAINAVMAGCKPEYMPVLCTLYELLFGHDHGWAASTMGYNAWYVIHGPVARQLGLNSAGGLLGPGARANVSIGRAARLGMMNLAGLKPDLVDRSCLGQAFKYGAVIAEDESGSPWGPVHVSFGLQPDDSAVTMSWGAHPRVTFNAEARDPRELLTSIAEDLAVITNLDSPSARAPVGGTQGTSLSDPGAFMRGRGRLIVMGQGHREILRAAGWTRQDTQEFLFERCKRRVSDARAKGFGTSPFISDDQSDEDCVPLVEAPDKFRILFGGGEGAVTISVSSTVTTRLVGHAGDKEGATSVATTKVGRLS